MKIILNKGWGFAHYPALALARYLMLQHPAPTFYLYAFDSARDLHVKRSLPEYEATGGGGLAQCMELPDFVSFVDYGETFAYPGDDSDFYAELSAHAHVENIRTNSDFIAALESLPERFSHQLEIVDIPNGRKYRVCEYDGSERLEFEDEIQWKTAQ